MATFKTMTDRLLLLLSKQMTETDIKDLLNRVHQEELEAYDWFERVAYSEFNSVALQSTGTVAITQDAKVVTGTSTSFDTTDDVGSFIRIGSNALPMEIASVASTTSLTLTTAWAPATETAATYQLFKRFYNMPSDCYRVEEVYREVALKKRTRAWIHRQDPKREMSGDDSHVWAPVDRTSGGVVRIELWRINDSAQPYAIEYQKGHTDMAGDNDRPLVPAPVIETRALYEACMAQYVKTAQLSWFQAASEYKKDYTSLMEKARAEDMLRFGVNDRVRDDEFGSDVGLGHEYVVDHDVAF